MPAEAVRLNLYLPPAVDAAARRIAADRGLSLAAVFRRALGVLDAVEQASAAGQFVGTTRHRENLEQIIVAPL